MSIRRSGLYLLLAVILAVLAGLVVAGHNYQSFLSSSGARLKDGEVTLIIPEHASFYKVAELLVQEGVIADARMFRLLGRMRKQSGRIQAGEFLFHQGQGPTEVLDTLVFGKPVLHSLTIPEGYTLGQIAGVFDQTEILSGKKFLQLSADPTFLADLGVSATSLEGYVFPSTYNFTRTISEEALIKIMVKRMDKEFSPERLKAAEQLGMSKHEILTLASIIEKEAFQRGEMPLISSVYHNRLSSGMRLQADPTVIYGLTAYNGNLTKKNLEQPTPYNTYINAGLPPGPIGNPGARAIEAALYPADTKYFFFVAKGDGSHTFSTNLADHNHAVHDYIKEQKGR